MPPLTRRRKKGESAASTFDTQVSFKDVLKNIASESSTSISKPLQPKKTSHNELMVNYKFIINSLIFG